MINNSHNKYIIFILLQSFLYGLGNPLTKIAFASITPLWCLAFRFGLAFSLFAIFFATRLRKQLQALSASQYLPAGLCMASAYISCNLALEGTTATNVGFIMSLSVIFAPLLSIIVLQRPYKLSHLPIQLLVILGMYLLCSNGGMFSFNQGDLWALLTAVSVAGALLFGDISTITKIQPEAWAVVIYLAITCTCLAYFLQNAALKFLSSSLVSMLQCTQPILTAAASYFLLNEKLTFTGMSGAVIILACIISENILEKK